MVAKKGQGWGRDAEGDGLSRCKLLYTEWINNKALLYSTGSYIQYPMINHNGKEHQKENVYMCITESLSYIAEISTTV